MNVSFLLALRQLSSAQKGTFTRVAAILATAGLAVGIASLLVTLFIIDGFENTLSTKIADFDGHLRIRHYLQRPLERNISTLDSTLELFPEVVKHSFIQESALLRKGILAEGVLAEGLEANGVEFLEQIIVDGKANLVSGSVILGQRLASKLNLKVGDKIVLFDLKSMSNFNSQRRLKSFIISGLFHSGLGEYDQSLIYLSLKDAQFLFDYESRITGYILRLKNTENIENLSTILKNSLPYPYMVMSWKEKNRALFKWMNIQRWPILFIFGLIAVVGIVNIVSALTMIVVEKISQIGIFASLGLSRRKIQEIFLYKGMIIGLSGSVLGAFLAILLAGIQINFEVFSLPEDIYFMDQVPISINIGTIISIILLGFFTSLLASLWPTRRAGKIMPAKALKYE
ncbi:MAG: ABC transporter permease [Candidatus Neomarinimicrobiota bacterium]